jgi:hypothetical protein
MTDTKLQVNQFLIKAIKNAKTRKNQGSLLIGKVNKKMIKYEEIQFYRSYFRLSNTYFNVNELFYITTTLFFDFEPLSKYTVFFLTPKRLER